MVGVGFPQNGEPDVRQRIAFWVCPDLKAEIDALRSGNTKIVLENARLLDAAGSLAREMAAAGRREEGGQQ
jgi:hypothetical protein